MALPVAFPESEEEGTLKSETACPLRRNNRLHFLEEPIVRKGSRRPQPTILRCSLPSGRIVQNA